MTQNVYDVSRKSATKAFYLNLEIIFLFGKHKVLLIDRGKSIFGFDLHDSVFVVHALYMVVS